MKPFLLKKHDSEVQAMRDLLALELELVAGGNHGCINETITNTQTCCPEGGMKNDHNDASCDDS